PVVSVNSKSGTVNSTGSEASWEACRARPERTGSMPRTTQAAEMKPTRAIRLDFISESLSYADALKQAVVYHDEAQQQGQIDDRGLEHPAGVGHGARGRQGQAFGQHPDAQNQGAGEVYPARQTDYSGEQRHGNQG